MSTYNRGKISLASCCPVPSSLCPPWLTANCIGTRLVQSQHTASSHMCVLCLFSCIKIRRTCSYQTGSKGEYVHRKTYYLPSLLGPTASGSLSLERVIFSHPLPKIGRGRGALVGAPTVPEDRQCGTKRECCRRWGRCCLRNDTDCKQKESSLGCTPTHIK